MIGFPISRETAGDIWAIILLIVWLIINAALLFTVGAVALGILFFFLSFI